jgi:pilus assembly protein CpaF
MLGPLSELWRDPAVTDLMANGPGQIWVERSGALLPTPVHLGPEELTALCHRLLHPLSVPLDRAHPVAEARLPDGTRVTVVGPPVAADGPVLALRRAASRPLRLTDFGDDRIAELLATLVGERANVVVVGGTGSGKTALLGAMCAACPPDQRLVVIEDTAELRLDQPQVVRLEARDHPLGPIDGIRQLVRSALRLRPDRIVVGEVRGAEALDMVWALNTGHPGSMSTLHADGPAQALNRLETLCLTGSDSIPPAAVARQVRNAIDAVVLVCRGERSGRRHVAGVWSTRLGAGGSELHRLDVEAVR